MCWTAGVCQQAPPTCSGEGAGVAGCCHRNCLSGCYGPSRNECLVCRSVHHNGACMDVCPEFTYKLSDRRCISEEQCRAHRGGTFKLHSGSATAVGKQCVPSCPNRFTDDPTDKNKCIGCIKACPKVCTMNISIGTASEAEQLYKQRCTVINGSLEIQIGKGDQMVAALEQALEDLEEVKDYIRIAQSHALVSLGFFKSLRVIRGERLYLGSYALQVMDNQNLENLIEFKDRAPLEITNKAANMSFHYNPRLCLYKIEDFLLQTKHSKFYTTKDISETSNGDRVACNITKLTILSIMYQWNNEVEVTFSTFRELEAGADDFRALLGYILYYREAPGKNVSKYEGRDACSSDLWKRIDVGPHDLGELTKSAGIDVKKLKPARQYAVYVTTFTISTERKGGQTDIMYFTTRPKQPSKPLEVRTESVGPHDIKVYWKPPKEPNGPVTYYRVRWYKARAPADRLTERNYCKQPIQRPRNYFEELTTTTTPRPDLCPCNATLGGPGGPGAVQRLPDEEMMKDTIDMENFILDNVFYKGDFGGRARRDTAAAGRSRWARQVTGSVLPTTGAPRNTTAPADGNGTLLVTIPPGLTMPPVTLRTTTPNPKLEARETQVRDAREWRIRGLHHFTDYVISVFACHEPSSEPSDQNNSYMYPLCSDEAFANPSQTLAKRGADDIPSASVRVSLNEVNSSSAGAGGNPDEVAVARNVHVYWKDPHQPNGVIVTVEIEYHLVDKENKSKMECIPRTQRTASHAILDFSHAAAGNYSFRLRASSFASNGSWTEARFVELAALPSTAAGVSMPTLIGIVVGVILAVVLIAVGVFYVCRKRLQKALPSPNVVSINPDYYAYKPDEWEVPRENIERGRKIGSGTFGDVYEGIAKNIIAGVERLLVAIKEVDEAKSPSERNFFLQEASIMKNFRCHHVVKLLGIVSEGQPVWVIMEYMASSDLKTWLRNQRPEDDKPDRRPPAVSRMLQMAGEICDGMAYIHSRKFVHRDLAARNCMVADDLTVKIGDFGMTRDVYETDYYRKGGKGLLPVRWMAPESLKDGLFTSESDVWSFGVVLWEIVTLAAQPYQGLSNEQVLHFVLEGRLMPRPENCPDHIYDIMTRCWSFQVHNRPTFLQIIEGLLKLAVVNCRMPTIINKK
ncbi:insulin-like peptide receptor [Paramacrobiotus metropolitanus]|uniref:insulin-like peptide receptor n=1 Tax=Paramacrobiotus metropolitanus TaxID=2943436 RepID=UPI002445F95D|nr:insulin-like peptide receptor [Paramacrobiotus metropolitanus]